MSELSPHTKRMLKALEKAEEERAQALALEQRPERLRRQALVIKGRPRTPDSQLTPSPPTPPSPVSKKKKEKENEEKETRITKIRITTHASDTISFIS